MFIFDHIFLLKSRRSFLVMVFAILGISSTMKHHCNDKSLLSNDILQCGVIMLIMIYSGSPYCITAYIACI
jgi:hypothetical protein